MNVSPQILSSFYIDFYLYRIRQASLPELIYRLNAALFLRKAKRFVRTKKCPFIVPDVSDGQIEKLKLPDMILNNNESYKSVTQANETIMQFEERFKSTLFSDVKLDGAIDIRSVWEPARLQNVAILFAGLNDIAGTNKDSAKDSVLKWLDSNTFLFGPHHMSAMECGLRIPVFFYCLKAHNALAESERLRLLTAIYEHAWWVSHRLSLYSSLGNHTVAEAVGLVFAGAVFQNIKEGKDWLDRGHGLLKQELHHQILNDGGPAEQSLSYHRFVLDLYWLAVDFMEANGLKDCTAWKPRLTAGEHFLQAFTDASGNIPSIGDSDDGHAVAPGVHPKRACDDFVETRPCVTFPDSGYTVMRGNDGLVLTFDHGPLGMAPLYNHGHADALSITFSVAGEQVLVDPGTYRYNGVPEWRRYFKGTRAHNTVTVDGKDQADQETGFIWSHPYNLKLIKFSNDGDAPYVEATHDGYTRLREPITHKRVVDFCSDSLFFIKDSFSGKGIHKFELNFHIHPDAMLIQKETYSVIKKQDAEISITLLRGKQFRTACGETTPPFGWYSPAYGKKVQSSVLSCQATGAPDQVSFVTAISIGKALPSLDELERTATLHISCNAQNE